MAEYLTDIPLEASEWGASKVLSVRRETIHIKHIFTEVFCSKSLNLEDLIHPMTVMDYMMYMTHRMRRIHHINREIALDPNLVVNSNSKHRFFPYLELLSSFKVAIVLDFDGVVTDPSFEHLYILCIERATTYICSANPSITEEYFKKRNIPLPKSIFSMKGSSQKKNKLLRLNEQHDFILYIDNETKYLTYAWIFGIHTYHWANKKIINFSLCKD